MVCFSIAAKSGRDLATYKTCTSINLAHQSSNVEHSPGGMRSLLARIGTTPDGSVTSGPLIWQGSTQEHFSPQLMTRLWQDMLAVVAHHYYKNIRAHAPCSHGLYILSTGCCLSYICGNLHSLRQFVGRYTHQSAKNTLSLPL